MSRFPMKGSLLIFVLALGLASFQAVIACTGTTGAVSSDPETPAYVLEDEPYTVTFPCSVPGASSHNLYNVGIYKADSQTGPWYSEYDNFNFSGGGKTGIKTFTVTNGAYDPGWWTARVWCTETALGPTGPPLGILGPFNLE